jgi:low affinity Fe/Cu permease
MSSSSKISRVTDIFCALANEASRILGSAGAFAIALLIVLAWGLTGPLFNYSDTWQLVINTGTTIVTFLMVFLIQNTQNRDSAASQLKLDEIIRSTKGAHNALLDLEKLSQADLEKMRALYTQLANAARRNEKNGLGDTGTPEVAHGAKSKTKG